MRFLFLLLDFIVFFVTTAITITVRSFPPSWNTSSFLNNCKVMVPIFILNVFLLLIFSFYDFKRSYKRHENYFIELSMAFIVAFVLSATGIYFGLNIFDIPTPKTNLLLILLIFYAYVFLSRKFYDSLHFSQIKIISLGSSRTLNKIKTTISQMLDYKIVYDFKSIDEIPENLDTTDIDFLLTTNALLETNKDNINIIFNKFISKGIFCLTDLIFFEYLFDRLPKETLRNITWLIKDISNKQKKFMYSTIKRIFDVLFATILIPICLPVGIIIYFLILFIDRQKPIFFQERVGFEGKSIQICKFRTLIVGTETPTKVGKFLRKFRLDEIPQLINILDGDISIVGPRPLCLDDNNMINKYIYVNSLRNLVKPGLTGWSQLNFKAPCNYSISQIPKFENENQKNEYFKDAYVRLAYDIWYVKNASVLLDMEIMFKTAKRMFVKDKILEN